MGAVLKLLEPSNSYKRGACRSRTPLVLVTVTSLPVLRRPFFFFRGDFCFCSNPYPPYPESGPWLLVLGRVVEKFCHRVEKSGFEDGFRSKFEQIQTIIYSTVFWLELFFAHFSFSFRYFAFLLSFGILSNKKCERYNLKFSKNFKNNFNSSYVLVQFWSVKF